jgi:predicted dehydrogenase
MASTHAECLAMIDAFGRSGVPLWVAYYRRAQARFRFVRQLIHDGRIGRVTSAHTEIRNRLAEGYVARSWHFDPAIAGAGLAFDVGSHCVDLLDFCCGPIEAVEAVAVNTGGAYPAEDVTTAAFRFASGIAGTAVFNFNAFEKTDDLRFVGTLGEIRTPVFSGEDVVVRAADGVERHTIPSPPHVHQPLIQTIVDELRGRGRCESTAESGARAQWVLDRCVKRYYEDRRQADESLPPGTSGSR